MSKFQTKALLHWSLLNRTSLALGLILAMWVLVFWVS
jgi:hypothetical protein